MVSTVRFHRIPGDSIDYTRRGQRTRAAACRKRVDRVVSRGMDLSLWVPNISDSHFHSAAIAARGLDIAAILDELFDHDAGPMLDVGIEPEDVEARFRLVGGFENVYRSVGLHPSSTGRPDRTEALQRIERELQRGVYRAVGETGLDWYRLYAPMDVQIELFTAHLKMASAFNLPVIVHNRDADEDTLRLLSAFTPPRGGVMHCFSGTPEWVDRFLEIGMYISFAGNVTFKKAETLRDAARRVPPDRLLIETDAPFLSPHPLRGRDNHPGLLGYTLHVVADARGDSPEKLATQTRRNLERMLSL